MRIHPRSRHPVERARAGAASGGRALHHRLREPESFCTILGDDALRFLRSLEGKGNRHLYVSSIGLRHLDRAVLAVMQSQTAADIGQPESMAVPIPGRSRGKLFF